MFRDYPYLMDGGYQTWLVIDNIDTHQWLARTSRIQSALNMQRTKRQLQRP
ncbi:hypothetical protein ACX1C1_19460 [Paenibacillus sp. strain BS8-2]